MPKIPRAIHPVKKESKDVALGMIPYEGYVRPKCPKGMSLDEWAESVFMPDKSYKGKWLRWQFYARISYTRPNTTGTVYQCIPLLACDKKHGLWQAEQLAKHKHGKLLDFWRDSPVSWKGYNVPWNPDRRKDKRKDDEAL